MKTFWFIFSLFIFNLSVTPCCEDENECREECSASCSSDENDNQEEQKECSPFCTCEMCGLHAFEPAFSQALKIPVNDPSLSARPGNFYRFQFISEFEANIWQPPRLS